MNGGTPPPSTEGISTPTAAATAEDRRLVLVDVRGVTKTFGSTPALRGISCKFVAGSITLLGGPNGAGKSTLLALLGTQLKPTRGELHYTDRRGFRLERKQVRCLTGWVSHEIQCYAQLTGRENIELAARLHGVDVGCYEPLRQRLGLGRFAERPVASLSRGQRQRVALARALVHQPDLLLLDEPWTGLDRRSSQLLENVVLQEADDGATVVVVSHQEGLAQRLGATELKLNRGRVDS